MDYLLSLIGIQSQESVDVQSSKPPWKYSKCQTRAEDIEKCLDEGLDPTYYSSIAKPFIKLATCIHKSKWL